MNWFPLLKALLMTTAIGISKDRHKTFCLLYFYLWALYVLVGPTPSQAGLSWYWFCMSGEASIIALAIVMRPRVAPWIIGASVINILADCASLIWFRGWIYPIYPYIIMTMEFAQCIFLVVWSQTVVHRIEQLRHYLLATKGETWMRRLFKQVTT